MWKSILKIAYEKAQESTNISTQNSALLIDDNQNIIISEVNSFPVGVVETEERQRKEV
jgi:deoxycytidylate deaminase